MNDKIKAIGGDWIPALQQVYMKIQQAIDDPKSTFKDIANIANGCSRKPASFEGRPLA